MCLVKYENIRSNEEAQKVRQHTGKEKSVTETQISFFSRKSEIKGLEEQLILMALPHPHPHLKKCTPLKIHVIFSKLV